ncbi:helix-turn-helix transcriptional regulator [Phenylobacterium montanum]|uniref:Helix-turn-helix transcriptional regulator n=2 Tax=Phenylobacterium montanum TaxID=2823693 RepID=A0A975G524_9CAUL|nr:helix-turn-helix transcriptional regulator [Caulobacter sp. S6]
MTQDQLAQEIGVSFQQIQKYERGANRLSASMLFEVARALDVPVQWFFEGAPVAEPGSAGDHPALEFLMSDEGGEILDLFPRIENRALRRRLLQLLRHLAR